MGFQGFHVIGAQAPGQAVSGLFANRVFGVEVLPTLPGQSLKTSNPPTDPILTVSFLPRLNDQSYGNVGVGPQILKLFHEFLIVLIVGMKN